MDAGNERPGGTHAPGASSSRVIGLTGGIASGKNAVADQLVERGARIIDADRVSRDLVQPGSLLLFRLEELWGEDILDSEGCLDRARLAARVFGHPEEVARLNALMHPAILREIRLRLAESSEGVTVLMAPLLFEAGADALVDEVWVVRASPPLRLERLRRRDGLTEEQGRLRLAAQLDEDERLARADVIIDNEGDLASLRRQVEREWQRLLAKRWEHGSTQE